MTSYSKADTTAQWFEDNFPGATMHLKAANMVLVIHTTEGTSWPGYSGGATAPNLTGHPFCDSKQTGWRQHYPFESSSRALVNKLGGVETNTLNVVQVELVGTCDPTFKDTWGRLRAGIDYIYWPDAPDWALQDVADLIRELHQKFGLRLGGPRFKAYPASYGANGVRMTNSAWRNFTGVCGHQHVPENVHGDPGAFPIGQVLHMAQNEPNKAKPTVKPAPPVSTRVTRARAHGDKLIKILDAAVANGRVGTVKSVRDEIRKQLDRLPKS